jgi:citronellyl-CoA dehydrogenase
MFANFTEEHDLIRQTVKRFCQEQIAPHAAKWDEEGIFPREIFTEAARLGLFGIRIDSEWDGAGMDWWASAAYLEAMAHSDSGSVSMALMVQSDITIPAIDKLGTREQKEEFLRPAVKGEQIAALGISEPGGGSDVANIKTTARIDGGDLVIKGQKLWITNGVRADFVILGVRTGGDELKGHRGLSFVLVPTKSKGFSVGKKLSKIGNLASDTAELFFDDVRVPLRNLLGEMNRGFYYIMENFQGERLALALGSLGACERAIRLGVAYGKERTAFGQPIGGFQVWKHRWADHLTNLEAGRWLTYRGLDLYNQGQRAVREISMAKLYLAELQQKVTYDSMQIHGGFGYTNEYPIGRMWRDGRLATVGGGTSEIMREIIAKEEKL